MALQGPHLVPSLLIDKEMEQVSSKITELGAMMDVSQWYCWEIFQWSEKNE